MKHHAANRSLCVLCLLTLLCIPLSVSADDIQQRALDVREQHQDAVVTVELVVRQHISMMGLGDDSEESRIETSGVIVDNTGLTLVPLSATDPLGMMAGLMGGMFGDEMQMRSEITDARILIGSDTIPASIVLRDKDNDLAFLRPKESPDTPLPYVDMETSVQPGLLDTIVTLDRKGRVVNRVVAVVPLRITAVQERPRRYYLAPSDAIGAPAFDLDGQFVGVFVTRTIDGQAGGAFSPLSMMSGIQDSVSIILMPADTIREAAEQAPPVNDEAE